jgi:hypothetical protein
VNDSTVMNVLVDVRKWLPGDAVFDGSLFPDTLPEGSYDFRAAMLDSRTSKPAVRFAIAGREPDGWNGQGQIRVTSQQRPR